MRDRALALASAAMLVLTGCTAIPPVVVSAPPRPAPLPPVAQAQTGNAPTKEVVGREIVHIPVTADLSVSSTRVSATVTVAVGQEEAGKAAAVRQVLSAARADVLVAPIYAIEKKNAEVTVTVTGYPATYRDFRNATEADLRLLRSAPPSDSVPDSFGALSEDEADSLQEVSRQS